jgi:hypothetical protein
MRRKLLWTCLFGTVVVITGCGGGGGGGGTSATMGAFVRTEVPYHTPVRVATVDPLIGTTTMHAIVDTYAANISGGTGQDIVIAGRATEANSPTLPDTKLSIMSWQNGTLVDRTAQWFPGGINQISGTEPSVHFEDFFRTGRTDMFVAPSSDSNSKLGSGYFFNNNGTSFSRQTIGSNIWAHDSAVADFDKDGYKDIFIMDYNGTNTTLAINDRVSSFRAYTPTQPGSARISGSGVAAADFLNNNTTTLIVTDNHVDNATSTRMYSWNIDNNDRLGFSEISILPQPRFTLPKWAPYGITTSHAVRVAAHDFNNDNVMDAIVFSRPGDFSKHYSEVQFLKNNGGGNFSDVTDTTLVNYNNNTQITYQPKFLDLNGDGLTDILVSGNNSAQFLLKSADGKYVATFGNVMADFLSQTTSMTTGATTYQDGKVNVIRGSDGQLYLVTTVNFMNGSDNQIAVYASKLGTQSTTTAQSAINLIQQKWAYMSPAQANAVLAQTAATYFNGVAVIDEDAILRPFGNIGIPLSTGSLKPISGYLAGVDLGSGSAIVMDSLGRSFDMNLKSMNITRINAFGYNTQHNDQYELTSHAEYLVNGALTTVNGMRVGTDWAGRDNTGMGLNRPTQYTVGVPRWYSKGAWSVGSQYTYLNTNPWIAFGGAWGEVTGSGIMDNVVTYRNRGFSAQASAMHVSTNITPGLITRVNNMWGAWAETGYRFGDVKRSGHMGIYAGIKPVVLSGSIEASIPTAVDMSGNVVYTNKKLMVQNQTTGYVRALYTNQLTKQTQLMLSAVTTTAGQYRAMTELKFWID